MDELENALKEAYNNYIDSLVDYLTQWNQEPGNSDSKVNNATKYILDNSLEVGLRNSREWVRSASTERLLSKKVI